MYPAAAFAMFDLFGDLGFWFTIIWWVWLAYVAWYLYSWAQQHLAFSPLLTLVVAGILVYYLVFEYPLAGSFMAIMSLMLFSGLLWMLPWLIPFIPGINKIMKH